MSFPPQGTSCADCGCCQAGVYADNAPLCWECDAGEICKSKQRAAATVARVKGETHVGVKSMNPRTTRISEEIRAAILAEPAAATHVALAREYGVSDVSVASIRRQARGDVKTTKVASKPAPKAKAAPKPEGAALATRVEKKHAWTTPLAFPGDTEGTSMLQRFQDGIRVLHSSLDAAWAELSVEHKARALQMHAEAEG